MVAVTTNGLVDQGTPAAAVQASQWAIATGTSDALVAAFPVPNTALTDGLILGVRATAANATATPTFTPDNLTPHTITKAGGRPLAIGDIPGANSELFLRYNLANTRWELLNYSSSSILFKALAADDTGGQNVNTAQPWFPTAGGITLPAATSYFFDGTLLLSRAAGTTSHTLSLLFGGTATITSLDYLAGANTGDVSSLTVENTVLSQAATAVVVKAASISATEQVLVKVEGILRTNAGGTFIPQFTYSAAPGGAPTVKRGSYFRLTPGGSNTVVNTGPWA